MSGDKTAELVDVGGLSADDDVVGAGDVFGLDRVHAAARMDDAIEIAVALADETPDPDLPGGGGVLITGSVITAGEARQLLLPDSPTTDLPAADGGTGRHPFTAADLS